MTKRKTNLLIVAIMLLSRIAAAQIPNYIPTNGLNAWWPFNGNANDESGAGHNGNVSGATLTTDRFGNTNKAYNFDGINDYILTNLYGPSGVSERTISFWANPITTAGDSYILTYGTSSIGGAFMASVGGINGGRFASLIDDASKAYFSNTILNNWHFYCLVLPPLTTPKQQDVLLYMDGVLLSTFTYYNPTYLLNTGTTNPVNIGKSFYSDLGGFNYYKGAIDDIGIWNRALTQQEITILYEGCTLNTSISQPVINANIGSNVSYNAICNIPSATIQWQSNQADLGWINIPSNTTYNGSTSNTLGINNIRLQNHLQEFRVISTYNTCQDTSNLAHINITDTCITIVHDTVYTSVTDTLIINTTNGATPPNNTNIIQVYPNPSSDHITIDYGDFASMANYSITITNSLGQVVFSNNITQASSYIDLSTWNGNGLYLISIINPQGNTIITKKIILQ